MDNHLVLDLETFGVKNNAVVTEIGYAIFTEESIVESGCMAIAPTSCLELGASMDLATLQWRSKNTPNSFERALNNEGFSIDTALHTLNSLIEMFKPVDVWANSPTFDCTILRWYCEALGHNGVPWGYGKERDVRTIRKLFKLELSNTHDGGEDAVNEAKLIMKAISLVKGVV